MLGGVEVVSNKLRHLNLVGVVCECCKKVKKKKKSKCWMLVKTKLKDFQERAVEWMCEREVLSGGGMLLNEPGLGKTLCCLSVMVRRGERTLVVCPASLIKTWESEIRKHTSGLSYSVYHGAGRKICEDSMLNITSYTTLSRDRERLREMRFERIILDEGHYIRNSGTKVFKVVKELGEENALSLKWVVTATPIFNSVEDMFGYFVFLNLEGVENRRDWNKLVRGEESEFGRVGIKKVNECIKRNGLRMEKREVYGELREKKMERVRLRFEREEEGEFYEALVRYSLERMKKLLEKIKVIRENERSCKTELRLSKVMRNNVMVYIIRLKQACDSVELIIKSMNRIKDMSVKRSIEMLNYYNKSINEEEECVVCYDAKADSISESCGHKLCGRCWEKIMRLTPRCPMCLRRVGEIRVLGESPEVRESVVELFESTKFKHVLRLVREILSKGEKVVIVSQYVMCLDLIKRCFERDSVLREEKYISIQGSVRMEERMEMIEEFQRESDVRVCFLSLNAGAEGLTLTSANHLIFVDEWWNESKMEQCADRIHRIGQEKQVYIYNLKIQDSIEERIEELVRQKGDMVSVLLSKEELRENVDLSWMSNVVKLLEKSEG